MPEARKRCTLKDVAAACDMDVSTVSRALNNDPRVKPNTRQHILSIARQMRYRPNMLARSLVAGRSNTILFLISSLENQNELQSCKNAAEVLAESGYDLFTALYSQRQTSIARLLNRLRQGVADGAFLFPLGNETPEELQKAADDGLPLILIDRAVPGVRLPLITTANADAAAELVRRLANRGCTRFFTLFHEHNSASRERLRGAREELARGLNRDLGEAVELLEDYPAEDIAILANSQHEICDFLSMYHKELRGLRLLFGVFDYWTGEPYPAEEVHIVVQNFQEIGQTASRLLLLMLKEGASLWSRKLIEIPALEFRTLKPAY